MFTYDQKLRINKLFWDAFELQLRYKWIKMKDSTKHFTAAFMWEWEKKWSYWQLIEQLNQLS